jgi:RNA polymerase sigma-70 factor (ECF subfamily)
VALSELPAAQREAVLAHVLGEQAYREIARDAGVSEALIRQRVSRGLRALRHRLARTS